MHFLHLKLYLVCLNDRFICIEGPLFVFQLAIQVLLSFCKDNILAYRAIPKALRLEYQQSLLDFGPQDNTQIS